MDFRASERILSSTFNKGTLYVKLSIISSLKQHTAIAEQDLFIVLFKLFIPLCENMHNVIL